MKKKNMRATTTDETRSSKRKRSGVRRNTVLCGYANIRAGQVHVRSAEGIEPAIVFLHQTASASSSFHAVMERLALPNRLIGIDTPGFGGSFDPPGWPRMPKYADWVIETLDELGVKSAHFFGHHTGGSLSLEIASRFPARVKSVMLLGPVAMTATERKEFRAHFNQPFSPKPDGSHLVQNWNYAYSNNKDCDLDILHGQVVNMVRALKGRPQAYSAVSFQDATRLIRNLKVPLMLMSCEGDYFYPHFKEMCDLRPDAEVAIVGGDAFPTIVDSAGVAAAIERFVKKLGAKGGAARVKV